MPNEGCDAMSETRPTGQDSPGEGPSRTGDPSAGIESRTGDPSPGIESRTSDPSPGIESRADWLARDFEAHRPHLRAVALRMLGSPADADDAVQEAWLRLSRSDTSDVANLGGWLTTVVARVSLDMLRSRASRREDSWDAELAELVAGSRDPRAAAGGANSPGTGDPAHEAELADSVGLALLVVLETLAPAERLAFVLHDLFGLPFEEIADIVDRSPAATRQLASRARRRVRSADIDLTEEVVTAPAEPAPPSPDRIRQRAVVSAFLAASRGGDFTRLLELLDPDVVMRADAAAVAMGSPVELRGSAAVAEMFRGRAQGARLAAFDDQVGAIWTLRGVPKAAFAFRVAQGRVVGIDLLADEAWLGEIGIEYLRD
jgi:RNA polymerase sigma-70 factor (ECF subfamily)